MIKISPWLEQEIVQTAPKILKHKYAERVLAPDHPQTREIRQTLLRILAANNLGVVKNNPDANHKPFSIFGLSGMIGARKRDASHLESNAHERELIVIDEEEMVNAFALPGEHEILCLHR